MSLLNWWYVNKDILSSTFQCIKYVSPFFEKERKFEQDLELQQCVNETYCLPETPKVVYGLRASTADIFVDNAAYRKFLFSEFNVSTVDEESSAILMVGSFRLCLDKINLYRSFLIDIQSTTSKNIYYPKSNLTVIK